MLRLYGTPQTRTFRPLLLLEEFGIPYELVKADPFGIADLNVASVWVTARLAQLDLSRYPNVDAWLARCTSRPALVRAATR
jgi:glutathione S-transferase